MTKFDEIQSYPDPLNGYSEVAVTVHIGKGDHFFFACVDDLKADLSQYTPLNELTDFCTEIPTLKPSYARADNMILTFKPLDCALDTSTMSPNEVTAFNANCVDLAADPVIKPVIYTNSGHVFFNITNAATFEDLVFLGNDNYAFYTETPNTHHDVSEFPMKLCNPTVSETSNHGFDITAVA